VERMLDGFLFILACVAGAILFVFGVREIGRKAHSPTAMRFFLYLGIVLLSLGSLAGCAKTGRSPAVTSPSPSAGISLESQIGTYYKELQQAAGKPLSPDMLKGLDTATAEAVNKVDQLYQQKVISREASLYLRELFNAQFESIKNSAEGKSLSREEIVTASMNRLKGLDRVLSELNGTRQFDPFLCRVLKGDVKRTFSSLADIPLKNRLTQGEIGRSDYKELVSRIQDSLFLYFQKSTMLALAAPTPPVDDIGHRTTNKYGVRDYPAPIPMNEYGVRPIRAPRSASEYAVVAMYSVRPLKPDIIRVAPVSSLQGDLWLKQPGKAWVSLTPRYSVTTVSVIENRGNAPGALTTAEGAHFALPAGAVVTGWESQKGSPVNDLLQE